MAIDWELFQKTLIPIKGYEDVCRRLKASFAYPFVSENFNFSMTELTSYTQKLLGGDARGRYTEYETILIKILTTLRTAGVKNVFDLVSKVEKREILENFVLEKGVNATDIAMVLKYLIYWFIPGEKYLSGLVGNDPNTSNALKALKAVSVRTNLEILQAGMTVAGRKSLVERTGLAENMLTELVNRADLSRLPWSSKATISNIIGAGYGSLEKLASANPEQLYADFFRYGRSIGKNLKLGNEIENSFRIAKIVPRLVEGE